VFGWIAWSGTLQVVTRGEVQVHGECFSKRLEEVGYELSTLIRGDMGGNSMLGEHVE